MAILISLTCTKYRLIIDTNPGRFGKTRVFGAFASNKSPHLLAGRFGGSSVYECINYDYYSLEGVLMSNVCLGEYLSFFVQAADRKSVV